jgi:hypothetical protein
MSPDRDFDVLRLMRAVSGGIFLRTDFLRACVFLPLTFLREPALARASWL